MAKSMNYKTYKNKFEKFVKDRVPVKGKKFDKEVCEIIENAADFKQCYDPNLKVRKQLPKYWFVSKEGFLITVKGKKPSWVKPNLHTRRTQFKPSPSLKEWPKGKGITTYDLVALTWGSFISPDAEDLLNTVGADVIGVLEVDEREQHITKVQGHHWEIGYIKEISFENYVKNNNPDNIQIVTNKEHFFLEQLSQVNNQKNYQFRAPKHRNVYSKNPVAYVFSDGGRAKLEKIDNINIKYIESVWFSLKEEDFLEIEDYMFGSTSGADFIEDHKNELLFFAKTSNYTTNYEIHYGYKYYYVDVILTAGEERRVYYRKITK